MKRTMIGDLKMKIGQQVKIQGWLQTIRDQKKMQFLVIRDISGTVQAVIEKKVNLELAEVISALPVETAVCITGVVVENSIVKLGGIEIVLNTICIEGLAEPELPLNPFAATLPSIDFRMDWRYLDLRRPVNQLIFQVQSQMEFAMREYWQKQGFLEIHSPKLMGSPSESGAELFELPYFETKAYLAQSPQFYKQMAMAAGFDRVYEIGPVFRADPSFTSRHMTEFTSVDVEISWIDSHEDVMSFMEGWLSYIINTVKDKYGAKICERFGVELVSLETPFPRIPMSQAHRILQEKGHVLPPEKKGDIDPAGERVLGEWVKQQTGNDYFFLTDWPSATRPFYHMRHPDQTDLTRSFDLIGHGLELSTGSQREHRVDILRQQALEKRLRLEPIDFYLNFFRYGCPPHGGFGLGLSRLLMIMLGVQNIRETVYLFRGPTRLLP